MQAVILAGGLATRMLPRTETVPKLLLEIAGRPFVEWQLELVARCGIDEIVMCIAHLGEQVRAYVGDGRAFGVHVQYSEDPLLGTAGAVRAALPLLEEDVLVTYGDSYLPFDYAEPLRILRAHADCDAVMAIYHNKNVGEVSNVATDGTWVTRYDKTARDPAFEHVDYGATALRRSVIAQLPEGKSDLAALQHDLAARHRLRACVARERFYEIGSPTGLADLEAHLSNP
jgi:NDP-sugar pyrophosphorylase family protein